MKPTTIDALHTLLKQEKWSGVLSIRQDGQVLYEAASGLRDRANELPNTMDTLFGLASGAKTYTAVAILKLQEEGRLHLSDPVSRYLNDVPMSYPDTITIRHLLTHTSGIPDYLDESANLDLSHIPWSLLKKPRDYFPYFPLRDLDFEPGTRFQYNNGAYILLAHIIEEITGDYHAYVHSMLDQVGLLDTRYHRFDQLPPNTAQGYIDLPQGDYKTNIFELPIIGGGDGGIFSTVSDIHRFWQVLLANELLSASSIQQLVTPQVHIKGTQYYGLGVWIQKDEIRHIVEMVGEDQGVSCYSSVDLATHRTIVILSNNQRDTQLALACLRSP
jgi:CubicO group peptidase (beta-lactamase class C family)